MPESYSQASQDVFVLGILGARRGRYLEIGAGDPVALSNTYLLEKNGWTGLSFDKKPQLEAWVAAKRWAAPIRADATAIDWTQYPQDYDYLSLDVDDDNLRAVQHLPLDRMTFKVATIEHNAYIDGGDVRAAIREIMLPAGYVLACSDVRLGTSSLEDWWIHNTIYDPAKHPRIHGLTHEATIHAFFSKEQCCESS